MQDGVPVILPKAQESQDGLVFWVEMYCGNYAINKQSANTKANSPIWRENLRCHNRIGNTISCKVSPDGVE